MLEIELQVFFFFLQPCYEPQFRAPGKNTKSKKEEKCGLLSNMDVQPADTTSNDLF